MVATSPEQNHNAFPAGRRFYEIAGLTVQVESDLPITDGTFDPKFAVFEVAGPGPDALVVRLHFGLPAVEERDLGREVYRRPPWVIYRSAHDVTYMMGRPDDDRPHCVVVANPDHTVVEVYAGRRREDSYREGNEGSLTLMPTDQIVLARVLADRRACILHSCGVIMDGHGLLFVGHSEAGKSTMMTMLADHGEALCDDRNIVRVWDDGIRVHGSWSHGEVPIVSAASAPLGAILFLRKAATNRVVALHAGQEILRHLLPCVIKPLVTADWWQKTLDVIERVVNDVPCYVVEFDRSGEVVGLLRDLTARRTAGAEPVAASDEA